jgi:hypothetical protein
MKKKWINIMKNTNNSLTNILCQVSKDKCFFNQYSSNYTEPNPEKRIIFGNNIKVMNEDETRCFTKISFSTYDIFCTHLDANNKTYRRKQLDELANQITRESIIIGDFNIINTKIYGDLIMKYDKEKKREDIEKEWIMLRDHNKLSHKFDDSEINYITNKLLWKDSFVMSRIKMRPSFTTWSNCVVDYIFFTKDWMPDPDNYNSYVHFNNYSDHIPLIVDMEDKFMKNINVNKIETSTYFNRLIIEHNVDEFDKKFEYYYNGEALDVYDWYDYDKRTVNIEKNYTFEDPYMTGNYGLMLGSNGIYFLKELVKTENYISMFRKIFISNAVFPFHENPSLYDTGLVFKWKRNDNIPIILQPKLSYNGINKKGSIDDKADIILVNEVGKMTQKNYDKKTGKHNNFDIQSIYLVILPNTTDIKNNFVLLDTTLNTDIFIKCKEIFEEIFKEIYKEFYKKEHHIQHIENKCISFLNSIFFINTENKKRYGKILINLLFINKDFFSYINDSDTLNYDSTDKIYIMFDLLKYKTITKETNINGGFYYREYIENKNLYLLKKKIYENN